MLTGNTNVAILRHMTSGELATLLSELLGIPFPTVDLYGRHLRSAGLLSVKGHGRGAARMTGQDAANWLTALCIDHERGGDFVREVKRVLSLPRYDSLSIVHPPQFADDLASNSARTAGQAIAALIADTLVPRVTQIMEANKDGLLLSFDADGLFVTPAIQGPYYPEVPSAAFYTYQRGERKRRNIERTVTVHGRVLLEIAKSLELPAPAPT